MLQKAPPEVTFFDIPDSARLLLWTLAVVDVMNTAWMISAGEWLDNASAITAVITLGGHHLLVFWLAVGGFVTLGVLTALTEALTAVRRIHIPLLVLGALASVVAAGGALSLILLTVGVVLLLAIACGAIFGLRLFVFEGFLHRL